LTACASSGGGNDSTSAPEPAPAALQDLGTAPELTNEVWLNADTPLRLDNLRGKVVAIEMWTYG
jgi:hypothetical protein